MCRPAVIVRLSCFLPFVSLGRQAYVHDTVSDFAVDAAGGGAASPNSLADVDDPANLSKATYKAIVGVLRKLMLADKDQLMDVKQLRRAAADRMAADFKTKAWKRWFDDRVGELDVELEATARTDSPGGGGGSGSGGGGGGGGDKSSVASASDDFDDDAASADMSDVDNALAAEKETRRKAARQELAELAETAREAETLRPAPAVADCSDEFLDRIEDEVQDALDDGVSDEVAVRARVGKALGKTFETKEWVKYCKEVMVDYRIDKHADVREPGDVSAALRQELRSTLKAILVDDVDQEKDSKACRQELTDRIGVVFKSKVGSTLVGLSLIHI